jgi:two-component system LytT family sensor kinase
MVLQRKILKNYLIRNSYQLFLIYMVSSIMLISIYSSTADVLTIFWRSMSIAISSFIVFIANAQIIVYYKTKANFDQSFRNVQKRIFLIGYLMTLVVMLLHHLVLQFFMHQGYNIQPPHIVEISEPWKVVALVAYVSLMQYTFVFLIQNFTMTQYEKTRIEMQLLNLKASNVETVNLLLKQQIQPHFLFNALNTLKSLIRKKPDVAENYLIRLSDFLRASFVDHPSGMATLKDELSICYNYIEMQKVRFGETIKFEVDSESLQGYEQFYLPVFTLQPLLENAIKHNIATLQHPLVISIYTFEGKVYIENNLQEKHFIEHSTGKGLSNLKERYRIISGDDVVIDKNDKKFVVSLKLLKDENRNY